MKIKTQSLGLTMTPAFVMRFSTQVPKDLYPKRTYDKPYEDEKLIKHKIDSKFSLLMGLKCGYVITKPCWRKGMLSRKGIRGR